MIKVVINESYSTQRVSGQQRYAAEIAQRLPATAGFQHRSPLGFWSGSTLRVWAWVQFALPIQAFRVAVLSMTARAPLWCRRHIVVVHDLFVLDHPEWFSRRYVWTHAPLLRVHIKTAAAVVAVSQPVADQLATLRRTSVTVAPNAPSEVFRARDDEPSMVLAKHDVRPGSYFLSVGNREPRKNLHRLADAYRLLTDNERAAHPLLLVGAGASIYRDQEIEWPTGTIDVGYIDDDDLRRLYRDARTVVSISLAEGFGLPIVEAAAAGAGSLVVSDIAVFRWICGDQARYVDPTSTADVALALREEITTPSRHSIDIDRFSWDVSAEAVRSACAQVVGAGRVNERSEARA